MTPEEEVTPPELPQDLVDKLDGLHAAAEMGESLFPVVKACRDYCDTLIGEGFTQESAELMTLQFHGVLMNNLMSRSVISPWEQAAKMFRGS